MGEINQNLTGRSLRAFLIDDPVGATSQIIIDFNALFRKLRLAGKKRGDNTPVDRRYEWAAK
jgi:hypothetical protein